MKINDFLSKLSIYAPLSLSKACIDRGDHDNSGIIVKVSEDVNKVLFTLDLSKDAAMEAVNCGCDCIVTHHPAIYYPILGLDINSSTGAIIECIKNGISVISMHLNLDVSKDGIDQCLAEGLGGENIKIIDKLEEDTGYGRIFSREETPLENFVKNIKEKFNTDKIIYYGNAPVKKVASFCGAGGSHAVSVALKGDVDLDTVVTSDLAHHEILALVEREKNVVVVPHYLSEEYGFNKYYQRIYKKVNGKAYVYYFADKRFM
jgi:dinuclear metal center YbgI/SA1388 family protein